MQAIAVSTSSVYGILPGVPLWEYSLEDLQKLWVSHQRNRKYADVLALVRGEVQAEIASEVRILQIYKELCARDEDPTHM